MPSMYPNLSDEQLVERLRYIATAYEAELVQEQKSSDWYVHFMKYDVPSDPERERGVSVLGADSPDLRTARERLLHLAENP